MCAACARSARHRAWADPHGIDVRLEPGLHLSGVEGLTLKEHGARRRRNRHSMDGRRDSVAAWDEGPARVARARSRVHAHVALAARCASTPPVLLSSLFSQEDELSHARFHPVPPALPAPPAPLAHRHAIARRLSRTGFPEMESDIEEGLCELAAYTSISALFAQGALR